MKNKNRIIAFVMAMVMMASVFVVGWSNSDNPKSADASTGWNAIRLTSTMNIRYSASTLSSSYGSISSGTVLLSNNSIVDSSGYTWFAIYRNDGCTSVGWFRAGTLIESGGYYERYTNCYVYELNAPSVYEPYVKVTLSSSSSDSSYVTMRNEPKVSDASIISGYRAYKGTTYRHKGTIQANGHLWYLVQYDTHPYYAFVSGSYLTSTSVSGHSQRTDQTTNIYYAASSSSPIVKSNISSGTSFTSYDMARGTDGFYYYRAVCVVGSQTYIGYIRRGHTSGGLD